ncbi:hypothetical protein [Priestia aryabhattai]
MKIKGAYNIIFTSVIVSKIFSGLFYILLFYGYFYMFLIMDFIFLPIFFFIAHFRREKRTRSYHSSFWNILLSTIIVASVALVIATALLICLSRVYLINTNTTVHFLTYNIIFMISAFLAQRTSYQKHKNRATIELPKDSNNSKGATY